MRKINIGILLSCVMAVSFLSACGDKGTRSKVMLNEVLIDNETGFQDDYGIRNAWIEVFNRSYGTVDVAGYYLKLSSHAGDTISYFIPKGDVLTKVSPRQHALFWADGQPRRGTFHTSFRLDTIAANWIGLYDSGKKLIDQVTVPGGLLKTDQSYARVSDAADTWEVKDGTGDRYVTPSTNNKTIDSNPKMEKFADQDSVGVGMAISAMSVVFTGLLLLFIAFRIVSKVSVNLSDRNAMKAKGITNRKEAKQELANDSGEAFAAIAMALHEFQSDVHDVEDTILTITRVKRSYSPWSSKIYTLRETPRKK